MGDPGQGAGRQTVDAAALPVLTLDVAAVQAEPGGQATVTLRIRHPGRLVDSFRVEVVGLAEGWWQAHPPVVPVFPGKEATAVVVLTPPRGAEAPGAALPFGVRIASTLDADRSAVEEGDLQVERVFDLQSKVVPVTSRARWSGRHRLEFVNWGNGPVRLHLRAHDPDDQLGFMLTPESVVVPVGGTVTAKLRVRPRAPFLRGAPRHLPFTVLGEPPGAERSTTRPGVPDPSRPTLNAAVLHQPVLSRGVVMLATLLAGALAAGAFLLFSPKQIAGATDADAPAAPPSGLTVAAAAAGVMRVSWAPTDRATGYRVQAVNEETTAVLAAIEVPDGATAVDVPVKEPLTKSCYQVVSLRAKRTGPPGEVVCATSLDDRLPPPTAVTATRRPDGRVAVTWKGRDRDEHLVLFDGAQVGQTPPGVAKVTVPAAPSEGCVVVVARQGATAASVPSAEACVGAAPPPPGAPSAGPTPGGGGAGAGGAGGGGGGGGGVTTPPSGGGTGAAPRGWVAQVSFEYPVADSGAATAVAQRQAQLAGAGVAGVVAISSASYPQLAFANPTTLLVVGGFTDAGAAGAFCAANPAAGPPCTAVFIGTPAG